MSVIIDHSAIGKKITFLKKEYTIVWFKTIDRKVKLSQTDTHTYKREVPLLKDANGKIKYFLSLY